MYDYIFYIVAKGVSETPENKLYNIIYECIMKV